MTAEPGIMPQGQSGRFRLTRAQVGWLSSSLVVLSVVLFILTTNLFPQNPAGPAIASALLSIGTVALVSEFVLKRAYTNELLDLVGLQQHLHGVGIRFVTNGSDVNWAALLQDARRIRAILLEPAPWVDREWHHILNAARQRPMRVDIYLPDPDGDIASSVANQLGRDPQAYRHEVADAANRMEEKWRAAKDDKYPLSPECGLTVSPLNVSPAYSIIEIDTYVIVLLQGTVPGKAARDHLALGFKGDNWIVEKWAPQSLEDAHAKSDVPLFTDLDTDDAPERTE